MSDNGKQIVIDVSGVTKTYSLSAHTGSLKSRAVEWLSGRGQKKIFKALDNISFQVCRGETLGIIGANGAGKSTLLSLLTGTLFPDHGDIQTEGQISSLLELGAGFHPDLTGRENVFLYGAIMGMNRAHMESRFDAIVAFAGLEQFIDQPVKYYSSGMYVRLGFAVAVEVDPDILLIDEVLAVGDAAFQRKCIDKMHEFKLQQKTMLIISHDLHTIQKISDRIVLLDKGQLLGYGSPEEMIDQYEGVMRREEANALKREWGTGEVKITSVSLRDHTGNPSDVFYASDGFQVDISFDAKQHIDNPVFGYAVSDPDGHVIHGSNTQISGRQIAAISGSGKISFRLGPLPLVAGNYLLSCSVHSSDHRKNYHRLDHAIAFAIMGQEDGGPVIVPVEWDLPGE
jgi:ABC-type polysaccharide/polyol phosphate transport system ATPase subunit